MHSCQVSLVSVKQFIDQDFVMTHKKVNLHVLLDAKLTVKDQVCTSSS